VNVVRSPLFEAGFVIENSKRSYGCFLFTIDDSRSAALREAEASASGGRPAFTYSLIDLLPQEKQESQKP
jgi:hypothetical protein